MLVSKQLFTCCLLVALSYTSAYDGEPAFKNDNVRAELSRITCNEMLDVCLEDLLETDCCAKARGTGLHTLATGEQVYCSNGWVIFQRRMDGSIPDFHEKSWEEYAEGFGDMSGEFWLGLRKIHNNTKQGGCRLRVDLQSFDCDTAYEEYSQFSVADEADLFRLSIGNYSGTAGDSLTMDGDPESVDNLNGMPFTTIDRDNDRRSGNCEEEFNGGGWWYNACTRAFLNGIYGKSRPSCCATNWNTWKGSGPMKFIHMGVRCD